MYGLSGRQWIASISSSRRAVSRASGVPLALAEIRLAVQLVGRLFRSSGTGRFGFLLRRHAAFSPRRLRQNDGRVFSVHPQDRQGQRWRIRALTDWNLVSLFRGLMGNASDGQSPAPVERHKSQKQAQGGPEKQPSGGGKAQPEAQGNRAGPGKGGDRIEFGAEDGRHLEGEQVAGHPAADAGDHSHHRRHDGGEAVGQGLLSAGHREEAEARRIEQQDRRASPGNRV